jgi:hypothetical protein
VKIGGVDDTEESFRHWVGVGIGEFGPPSMIGQISRCHFLDWRIGFPDWHPKEDALVVPHIDPGFAGLGIQQNRLINHMFEIWAEGLLCLDNLPSRTGGAAGQEYRQDGNYDEMQNWIFHTIL